MILPIGGVLDGAGLARVRALLASARFVDGRATAGWHARPVKDNEQANVPEAAALVAAALLAHPVFRAGALPRRLRPILFARYDGTGEYGPHVDDALMGETDPLRADVAVTVFLSEGFSGGELVLDQPGGESDFLLPAGSALTYPATTLHRVAPVTAGERLVALTWVQSLVRDAAAREMLWDLDAARRDVFTREGRSETFLRLAKTHANLLRRWAEP